MEIFFPVTFKLIALLFFIVINFPEESIIKYKLFIHGCGEGRIPHSDEIAIFFTNCYKKKRNSTGYLGRVMRYKALDARSNAKTSETATWNKVA